MIRNEGEEIGASLWRNPAVYIAFAAIAALVVALVIMVTRPNPASPQQAAPSQKGSLLDKVAEEPGKAARQDGAAIPPKTEPIVDKVSAAAPAQAAAPKWQSDPVVGKPVTVAGQQPKEATADPLDELLRLSPAQPKEAKPNPYQDVIDLVNSTPIEKQPAPLTPATAVGNQAAPLTPEALFAKAAPAVVKITARTAKGERVGTGFYVSEDGLIVTNYHVLEGVTFVLVFSAAGPHKEIPIGVDLAKNLNQGGKGLPPVPGFCDPEADVAVFRDSAFPGKAKTPHLELASVTSKPNIGARVYTIGNPHELDKTLSDGLISGFREWENGLTVIQTTVPISGGSSGGPLLDASGCVVGVIFASERGGQNLNYAVPVAKVRALVERAKAGMAKGETGNLEQELLKSRQGGDDIALARAALSKMDSVSALRIAQRLKDREPQNAEVWQILAMAQFFLKNFEQSLESANMAVALRPDYFEAYCAQAMAAGVTQRYDLELKAANAMVRLKPADHAGYSELGSALSNLRRHREATSAYETAVELASDDQVRACLLMNLAGEYETTGRVQEAINCLEKALAIEPADMLKAYAYESFIRCYLATGNKVAAQRSYEALKKLDPQRAAKIGPPLPLGRR